MTSKSVNQQYREAVADLAAAMRIIEGVVADLYEVHGRYDSLLHNDLPAELSNTVHAAQLRLVLAHDPRDLDNHLLPPVREWVAECNHRLADLPSNDLSEAEDQPCIRCGAPESVCECPDDLVGGFRLVTPVAVDDEK